MDTLDAKAKAAPETKALSAADPARILAVAPTLNEQAHIEHCIRSLLGEGGSAGVRLIVADGGSTDRTREIVEALRAEFPLLELMDNPKRLQSAALNAAAQQAHEGADILIRCDAHSVYPPNFLLDVAASLLRHDAQSLVIPMDSQGEGCFQKAVAWISDTPLGSGGSAHRGGAKSGYVDHGHHAGFELATFLALGGYDESFSHNEDAEYDARVVKAGGRIYLDAAIRIGYAPRATLRGLARQYFNYAKGRRRTIAKHRIRPRLRQMIPLGHTLALIASLALAPFSPLGVFYPAFYLALALGVSLGMAAAKRSLCGLWAGAAMATMHTSWGVGFLVQSARILFGRG